MLEDLNTERWGACGVVVDCTWRFACVLSCCQEMRHRWHAGDYDAWVGFLSQFEPTIPQSSADHHRVRLLYPILPTLGSTLSVRHRGHTVSQLLQLCGRVRHGAALIRIVGPQHSDPNAKCSVRMTPALDNMSSKAHVHPHSQHISVRISQFLRDLVGIPDKRSIVRTMLMIMMMTMMMMTTVISCQHIS